jgi:hypothetical protein
MCETYPLRARQLDALGPPRAQLNRGPLTSRHDGRSRHRGGSADQAPGDHALVWTNVDQDVKQLAAALVDGTKFVITTLQKFPFVLSGPLRQDERSS